MNLAATLKKFFLFGSGGYRTGRQSNFGWLPGTEFDYASAVGDIHLNAVANLGINWITRNFLESTPQMEQENVTDENTVSWKPVKHNLITTLDEANPWYDSSVLWMGTILSLIAEGDAYWFPLYGPRGFNPGGSVIPNAEPDGFLYVPHFQIQPVSDASDSQNRLISYYEFTPMGGGNTQQIPPEAVIHFQWGIDPKNPIRGLGPLRALLRELYSDNLASSYSSGILRNFGVPGLGFTPKGEKMMQGVTPEYLTAFGQSLRKVFSPDGAGTAFLSVLPWEVKQLGFSPEQMALSTLRSVPVSRICGAMGLDPMVIALESDNKTYSNYEVAERKSFYGGVVPIQTMIGRQFTRQVIRKRLGMKGYRLGWEHSQVRALQEDQNKLWDRVTKAVEKGAITRKQGKILLHQEVYDDRDDVYLTDQKESQQVDAMATEAAQRALARRKLLEEEPEDEDATESA